MAIYSLQCKIIGRGKQGGTASPRTVVAAAAYRSGSVLRNNQDGCTYDFTRKQGIVHSEIILPQGAPGRYNNRETLWNEVEATERRRDAQFCRELVIAMPVELSQGDNIKLARQYIQRHFVDCGMCADFSLHDPHGNNSNPHVHVLVTMRDLHNGRFDRKNRGWNHKSTLENWRELWADTCNKFLSDSDVDVRIDHRTLKAQGIDRKPTVHLGVEATTIERKGTRTEKGNINRAINAYNTARDCGVETPTILSSMSELWQRAADKRRGKKVADAPSATASVQQGDGQERDTCGGSVQRRTYTSPCDAVRQGDHPAPEQEKRNALQGDNKGAKPPLEEAQRQHQTSPSGEVLPCPVTEKKQTLGERLASWLLGDKDAAPHRGAAIYDIKVMSSMLSELSKHGIDSYEQLEQKIASCTEQASAVELRLADAKDKLHRVYYNRKVAQSCREAGAEATKLRGQLGQAQNLLGAALRCQVNRSYAEEYKNKVLFRENYYKKFGDKIDDYDKATKLLQNAGLSEHIEPAQLQQPVERIKRELKVAHGKYISVVETLRVAGIAPDVEPSYFEGQIDRLKAVETSIWRELQPMQRELEKWQRIAAQLDNVLEGRRVKEPTLRTDRDKNKDAPSR